MKTTLADDIVGKLRANPSKNISTMSLDPSIQRKVGNRLLDRMLRARRFYLDDEVTTLATEMGVQHPDMLHAMMERARAPFPEIWIEWPVTPQLLAAGISPADDAPDRTGVLIRQLHETLPLYAMTHVGYDRKGSIFPGYYDVVFDLSQKPSENPETIKLLSQALNEQSLRRSVMGSAYYGFNKDGELIPHPTTLSKKEVEELLAKTNAEDMDFREQQCNRIAEHATFQWSEFMGREVRNVLRNPNHHLYNGFIYLTNQNLVEDAGVWRFILSVLATINAQDFVANSQFRIGKSRLVSGKIVPFLEHRLVSLKLPRKIVEPKLKRIFAEAVPKRRHEVMGHFKHSRKIGNPNCEHVYLDETPTRQVCALCGAKRWWAPSHERGDSSIGYVTKDRIVETKNAS